MAPPEWSQGVPGYHINAASTTSRASRANWPLRDRPAPPPSLFPTTHKTALGTLQRQWRTANPAGSPGGMFLLADFPGASASPLIRGEQKKERHPSWMTLSFVGAGGGKFLRAQPLGERPTISDLHANAQGHIPRRLLRIALMTARTDAVAGPFGYELSAATKAPPGSAAATCQGCKVRGDIAVGLLATHD